MQHQQFEPEQLNLYASNARRGDIDAIAESLQVNGQYKPIVVNVGTHTGRPNEVLVGNHTVQAAALIGLEKIDAVMIDVTDEEARRIVLVDNRTSDVSSYDDELLLELLRQSDDLTGTGFDLQYVEDLEAHLAPPSLDELAERYGKPEESDLFVEWSVRVPERVAKELTEALNRFAGEPHEQAASLAAHIAKVEL